MWFNTTASPNKIFLATDITDDAAVWKQVTTIADAQTITGAKTFSAAVAVTDATSASSSITGALKVTGGISTQENLHVGGNLTVDGTTTQIDTTNLNVKDQNILINDGGNDASSEGAGITVERTGTDGSLVYEDALTSKFKAGALASESEIMTVGTAQTVAGVKTHTVAPDFELSTNYKQIATPANPASGDMKLYPKSDGNFYKLDDLGNEIQIGGAGAGGINHIDNPDFEIATTGYSAYADVAGVAPVDGTGGSPTVAINRTTVVGEVLRETASGEIEKDAANRQGEGVSYDFTIDETDKYSIQRISFDYKTSVNFADGDIRIYIYDVDNGNVIELTQRDLFAVSTNGNYIGEFQATNADDYRLIWHVSSTNASAYDVFIDNVQVGPRELAKGTIKTYLGSYTPSVTASVSPTKGTVVYDLAHYWRDGDMLEVHYYYQQSVAGTAGTGTYEYSFPPGLSVDSNKTQVINTTVLDPTNGLYSSAQIFATDIGNVEGFVQLTDTNTFAIGFSNETTAPQLINQSGNADFGNTQLFIQASFRVPIQGWDTNATLSSDFGNRTIATKAYRSAALTHTSSGSYQKVPLDAVDFDTSGAWSSVNGRIDILESGQYSVDGSINIATISDTAAVQCAIYINGVVQAFGTFSASGVTTVQVSQCSSIFDLNKGDYVELFGFQNDSASEAYNVGATTQNYLTVHKIQSPQTLLGAEKVAVRYTASSSQAVVLGNVIDFPNKVFDNFNAVSTGASWKFQSPRADYYLLTAQTLTNSVSAGGVNQFYAMDVHVDASSVATLGYDRAETTTSRNYSVSGTWIGYLEKGEELQLKFNEDIPAVNLLASASTNYIQIVSL
jgi:hypothetical protein